MCLRIIVRLALVMAAPWLFAAAASAHSASNSYLQARVTGADVAVQWSIALRDLDYAVGLDSNGDGNISWGEVRQRFTEIDAYALSRLSLDADGTTCHFGPVDHLADELGDGGYAVLRFTASCPAIPRRLGIHYSLLFELDPLHRGLTTVSIAGVPHLVAFSPDNRVAGFDVAPDYLETIATFFAAGINHLLSGIDHLLFVTMLLVPAMYRRHAAADGETELEPVQRFGEAFIETVKVLSAFTLAHATTLTLSVLHIVDIPQRLSETGIALTIFVTAIDNIWPIITIRRWQLAFFFGLVHGLGFANALGPLQLTALSLAAALVSFNLGLEAAQVIVAVIVLPFGFVVRNTWLYPHRLLPLVSGAVAIVALAWFSDRATGLGFMPF
jgi:hypothetical protein